MTPDGAETSTVTADGHDLAMELFLGSDPGNEAYADAIDRARDAVLSTIGDTDVPYSGSACTSIRDRLDEETMPQTASSLGTVLEAVARDVLNESVYPSNEFCVAHLQCPPMVPALAAEVLLSALNQSMDSFDQAPAATVLEQRLVEDLTALFGLGDGADGVLTSGGTQSNLQGLMLARDRYVTDALDHSVRKAGLPPEARQMRVLCSEAAHFTVTQAATQLGLGEDAVVTVPTDDDRRIDTEALRATLDRMAQGTERPFALVGMAGTTDFGSIDPLSELAAIAAAYDLWFHVDAAFGGGLAVSDTHHEKLAGIEQADSLAVDLHKLCFQPVPCGAFLLADGSEFELMARNAAYLNPAADSVPNLVGKSLQTTRRFDALKPYIAFRTVGIKGMGTLVDRTVALADRMADELRADAAFELACDPPLNVVTFRYVPRFDHPERTLADWSDYLNREARDRLLSDGEGVVARTTVDDRVHLKTTLLNPQTTVEDLSELLYRLAEHASDVEATVLDSVSDARREKARIRRQDGPRGVDLT